MLVSTPRDDYQAYVTCFKAFYLDSKVFFLCVCKLEYYAFGRKVACIEIYRVTAVCPFEKIETDLPAQTES